MKQANVLISILVSLSFIFLINSVIAYYPGDTINIPHDFGTENLIWTIVGNTTAVSPGVTYNTTHINVYFPTDMPPDTFTLVFMEETTREVIKEVQVSSGGGGGSRKTKAVNNTIIKEVPIDVIKYQDKIVTIEKIVNQTIEVPIELQSNKGKIIFYVLLSLGSLGVIVLIVTIIRKLKGGYKKNEEETNINFDGIARC